MWTLKSPSGRRRVAPLGILAAAALVSAAISGLAAEPSAAAPPSDLASDLIAAVNAFRATNGMAPLTVDPILMLVAQAQSEYNASTGSLSHYGPSGQLTRADVMAAGYGGGSTVFASENIAMGTGLTPQGAVQMWTGDAPHLNTMLGQYYRDVGAGVASAGGKVYYTLVTAYVAGGYSARSTVPAGGIEPPGGSLARPVVRATAAEDGSIVHVVEFGQTLWTIAAVYQVEMADLLELNGLSETSLLHPGDRVRVRAETTSVPLPEASATTGPTETPTERPTRRPTQAPSPTTEPDPAQLELDPSSLFAAWAVVVLIVGVIFAVRRL